MDYSYHKRYSSHFEFSEAKEAVISTLIYEYCAIKKITYSYIRAKKRLSDIEICFFNGERSKWNADQLDSAYIRQFGISVSNDGKRVFFQTWENGLYCFDSHSGESYGVQKANAESQISLSTMKRFAVCSVKKPFNSLIYEPVMCYKRKKQQTGALPL